MSSVEDMTTLILNNNVEMPAIGSVPCRLRPMRPGPRSAQRSRPATATSTP